MDLQELAQIIESGQHGVPFGLKLNEAEIARFANEKIGSLASNVSVSVTRQAISVSGKTKMAALTMDVQIAGTPMLEDGRLRFDMDSLSINGRTAPDFMRAQIANAINEKLDPEQIPVRVTSLELGEGWVEVAGKTK
ncbi:MAG: hypothetical protein HYX94_13920 [Chloroflexi bacterium]|nr:hypothetical protein [Chloroflexota bacterium]